MLYNMLFDHGQKAIVYQLHEDFWCCCKLKEKIYMINGLPFVGFCFADKGFHNHKAWWPEIS